MDQGNDFPAGADAMSDDDRIFCRPLIVENSEALAMVQEGASLMLVRTEEVPCPCRLRAEDVTDSAASMLV